MSLCWELCRPDGSMIVWLQARPAYCDRGRWHQGVEVPLWKSDADQNPRYYFDLDAGKSETEAYLTAKKIDFAGAAWVKKEY